MNTDHPDLSASRVMRLALITALFAIACGLPDSLDAVLAGVRALIVG
jgi:hypothetical protein